MEKTQKEQAQYALAHELFHPGWTLENVLTDIANCRIVSIYHITSIYEKETPVAVGTFCKVTHQLNVFVSPEHRGKNYGSLIIDNLLQECNFKKHEVYAQKGIEGSVDFYAKNHIVCFESNGVPLTDEEYNDFMTGDVDIDFLNNRKILNTHKEMFGQTYNQYSSETDIAPKKKSFSFS